MNGEIRISQINNKGEFMTSVKLEKAGEEIEKCLEIQEDFNGIVVYSILLFYNIKRVFTKRILGRNKKCL